MTDRLPAASRRWHVSKSHRKATPLILTTTTTLSPFRQSSQNTSTLRFLSAVQVITMKQRNKFKNNNMEGGDNRAEKAPYPSGAHKQQEPVSLWQHLQTFLLLSQKYLMLMLQRDASAAVLSQRTFDLAKLLVTRRKKTKKTPPYWMFDICHDKNTVKGGNKKRSEIRRRNRKECQWGWSRCEIAFVRK